MNYYLLILLIKKPTNSFLQLSAGKGILKIMMKHRKEEIHLEIRNTFFMLFKIREE